MNFPGNYIMATIIPLVISSTAPGSTMNRYELNGIITQKETGRVMPNVYVYAVKGEEEAITDKKGEFRFTSWQKLPITVYIRHNDSENIRVLISNPAEVVRIKL